MSVSVMKLKQIIVSINLWYQWTMTISRQKFNRNGIVNFRKGDIMMQV